MIFIVTVFSDIVAMQMKLEKLSEHKLHIWHTKVSMDPSLWHMPLPPLTVLLMHLTKVLWLQKYFFSSSLSLLVFFSRKKDWQSYGCSWCIRMANCCFCSYPRIHNSSDLSLFWQGYPNIYTKNTKGTKVCVISSIWKIILKIDSNEISGNIWSQQLD